ncbi:hypothetical protein ES708_18700 [subsurface metagenome]
MVNVLFLYLFLILNSALPSAFEIVPIFVPLIITWTYGTGEPDSLSRKSKLSEVTLFWQQRVTGRRNSIKKYNFSS